MPNFFLARTREENVRALSQAYPGDMIVNQARTGGPRYVQIVQVPYDGSTRQQRRALARLEKKQEGK